MSLSSPTKSAHTGSIITDGTSSVVLSAVAAIVLGVLLVGGAGFAAPQALHNAAHDSRHALAFPCH